MATMCPAGCGRTLTVHSRRFYCPACRQMMAKWAKRKPAEIIKRAKQVEVTAYRMAHLSERKLDQKVAVTQLRSHRLKLKRAA